METLPEPAVAAEPVAPQPKPAIWPLLPALVIAAVLALGTNLVVIAGFLLAGAVTLKQLMVPATMMRVPGLIAATVAATELSLLAASLVVPLLLSDAGEGLAERLHWRPRRVRALDVLLLTCAVVALGHGVGALVAMSGLWSGTLKDLDEAVRTFSGVGLVLLLIPGALGAGLCEEMLFRGVLQPRLTQRFGPAPGIGVSALAFGAMHLDPLHTPMAFLMGLLIGWAAWRSGTIVTGVLAHALNNTLSFAMSWAAVEVPGSSNIWGVLSGAVMLAACVLVLRQRWKEPARS